MQKILLISAISPTPQNSGGATRIHHTIKELSKYYQVDFITFNSSSFKTQPKKLTDKIPYWFSPWYSPKLISHIQKLIKKNHYDIIQIEFSQILYLIKYLPKDTKKIFVAHDISSVSFYRRIFENKPSLFKIIIRLFLFFQIYFYEKKYIPKFDTIISVSTKDQNTLKKHFPNKKILCLENGIDKINFLKKISSKIINLGYIGSFSHTPNLHAVKYFFNKIAPLLDKQKISYKFYLAGDNDPNFIKNNFDNHNLINLGQIKKTKYFYQKINYLITPIFSGSGSRIKILESLSFGVPIISSPIGAEGINIKTPYLQIANTPEEYLNCLKDLPKNQYKNLKDQLKPLLWKTIFHMYPKII
ncbi:MAG: glycosyltransferase family 4 protein [Candidatus Shapirobacteria bacterium]|jgi:glycosyltransferase involved in cell wall biosynthesis